MELSFKIKTKCLVIDLLGTFPLSPGSKSNRNIWSVPSNCVGGIKNKISLSIIMLRTPKCIIKQDKGNGLLVWFKAFKLRNIKEQITLGKTLTVTTQTNVLFCLS